MTVLVVILMWTGVCVGVFVGAVWSGTQSDRRHRKVEHTVAQEAFSLGFAAGMASHIVDHASKVADQRNVVEGDEWRNA